MNDDSKDPAKSGESSNIADSEDGAPLEADANAQGAGTGNGGGQSTAADDDEPVGYGRPPKKHQFKPGQSGNPKGRKKKSRGMKTLLRQELTETVRITEDGKQRSISKMELLIKRLVEQGAKGDHRSIVEAIKLGSAVFGLDDEAPASAPLSSDEAEILNDLRTRRAKMAERQQQAAADQSSQILDELDADEKSHG
jgi:hypothetical protein